MIRNVKVPRGTANIWLNELHSTDVTISRHYGGFFLCYYHWLIINYASVIVIAVAHLCNYDPPCQLQFHNDLFYLNTSIILVFKIMCFYNKCHKS